MKGNGSTGQGKTIHAYNNIQINNATLKTQKTQHQGPSGLHELSLFQIKSNQIKLLYSAPKS